MTFPSITRNAPVRTPVDRRPRSMSSTTPYERACVSANEMPIMSAANTTAVVIQSRLRSGVASPVERRRARRESWEPRQASPFTGRLAALPSVTRLVRPRIWTPPERLSKAEQRLLEDRHHQPVDDGPAGFFRFDEPGLLQHREMGRHGRLGHGEVVRQLARRHRPLAQQLQHATAGWIRKRLEHLVHVYI